MYLRQTTMILTLIVGFMFLTGCQKKYIPNTDILDDEFNREVIAFAERYRHAVENLEIPIILSLASPEYLDNSGTPTGDDDVDKIKLEELLNNQFNNIIDIRFEIKYREIFIMEDATYLQYTFTMSFQYEVDGIKKWHNHTGDKRLELEMTDDGYTIVSGM